MKMLILIFFEIHTDSILVYKFWQKKVKPGFLQEFKVWFWNRFWVKWNGLKYDSYAIIFVLYKGCVSYSWFFSEWEPKTKMIPLCATCTYTTPSTPLEIVQTLYISIMKVIVWWFDRKHDSYYLSDLSSRDLKIKMINSFLVL